MSNFPDLPNPDPPARKRSILPFISWGLIACLVSVLMLPLAGARLGSVAQSLNAAPSPEPIPTLQNATPMPGTTITIWFLDGPGYFSADTIFAEALDYGTTADGSPAIYVAFSEQGFNDYMVYWYSSTAEALGVTNPWIDLRSGGLMLYFDVQIGDRVERVGALYLLDESGTQLEFAGIEVGDTLLFAEEGSPLDQHARLLEGLSNKALSDLKFYDDQQHVLSIERIYLSDDTAQVLATE